MTPAAFMAFLLSLQTAPSLLPPGYFMQRWAKGKWSGKRERGEAGGGRGGRGERESGPGRFVRLRAGYAKDK